MKHFLAYFFSLTLYAFLATAQDNPSCEKLSDDFCQNLWIEHKGDLKTDTSEYLYGISPVTGYSHRWMMNQLRFIEKKDAVIDHLKDLGVSSKMIRDLRKKIKEYNKTLSAEKSSKAWDELVSEQKWKISNHFTAIAREQTLKRIPKLRDKHILDYDIYDTLEFSKDAQDLENKILEIKYLTHPKWKKIEEIFIEAKSDLIAEIQNLALSPKEKKSWIDKMSTVKLSLPYSDPRKLGARSSCSAYANNAYYFPQFNTFTVCIGSLNATLSEASHYRTIAHELSHAVDPDQRSTDAYLRTPAYQKTLELYQGKKLSCTDWDQVMDNEFSQLPLIKAKKRETHNLTQCLAPDKSNLLPFQSKTVRERSRDIASEWISDSASYNEFVKIVSPTTYINHKRLPNPKFNNPASFRIEKKRGSDFYFKVPYTTYGSFPIMEVFHQNLICASSPNKKNQSFYAYPDDQSHQAQREDVFETAIAKTGNIIQNILERKLEYTNNESYLLRRARLSKPSSENFADWLGFRAIARKITRIKDIHQKRAFVIESGADYCTEPGPLIDQPGFTRREKKFSYETHGDDRVRRLSVFTNRIRKLAQCDMPQTTSSKISFGDCQL